ncbi:MAG TPA: hypothetical protein VMA72_12930 [Streptosporangiaceae bacterium]|nr:hypothetical protein [Streptosporangiaceae bacterium]
MRRPLSLHIPVELRPAVSLRPPVALRARIRIGPQVRRDARPVASHGSLAEILVGGRVALAFPLWC